MQYREELARVVEAPARARRLLVDWVGNELDAAELDRAKLVVSELVNNAVLHGDGSIMLMVDLDEHRLRIEVIDEGRGFEHVVRVIPFEELSGRGLAIVDAEASRWGIHEGTTHVWAELERAGPRLGEHAKPEA
jgi:anti-sigma regulatory factor (Ser/Thr protein kinase)